MGLNLAQKKERSTYLESNLEITECSQRKPYVFISYASDDWEAVFKSAVVPLQKRYGLRVYADRAFDTVNDKWIVPMLRNVRGSDMLVTFVSQSYIESYACFLELLTAVNSRKQIVFVSLGQQLHLGDTTDQPDIERGVKNEILNQGSNLATNTNNTSNDIMRAMKSAYTSLSTLLEQDALSKYDISDAFINFFRDASINQKTIHDLDAVLGTIESISTDVFDPSLISGAVHTPPAPVYEPEPPAETPAESDPPQEQAVPLPAAAVYEPVVVPAAQAEIMQPEVRPEEAPPARSGTGKSGFMRRFSEAWKNNSQMIVALVGVAAGVLSIAFVFLVPPMNLLFIPLSVLGVVCGIKGLRSGRKALPIITLIISGFWPVIFLGVLLAGIFFSSSS